MMCINLNHKWFKLTLLTHSLITTKHAHHSANKNERCVFWASVGECTNNPVSPKHTIYLKGISFSLVTSFITNTLLQTNILFVANQEYMINECTLACKVCEKFVGVSVSSVVGGGGDARNEL